MGELPNVSIPDPMHPNWGVANWRSQIEHIMWGRRVSWSPLWQWPCLSVIRLLLHLPLYFMCCAVWKCTQRGFLSTQYVSRSARRVPMRVGWQVMHPRTVWEGIAIIAVVGHQWKTILRIQWCVVWWLNHIDRSATVCKYLGLDESP